jgi:hypothetical protein
MDTAHENFSPVGTALPIIDVQDSLTRVRNSAIFDNIFFLINESNFYCEKTDTSARETTSKLHFHERV